jgi:nicotinamidase-related amidase
LPFGSHDFSLDPRRTAIVVTDLTKHLAPAGTFERALSALGISPEYLLDRIERQVVPNTVDLIRALKAAGGTAVFTRPLIETDDAADWPIAYRHAVRSLGLAPCRPGVPDYEWLDPLIEETPDVVIDKRSVSAFCETQLERALRDRAIEHVLMTGCTTNFGVGVSAVDAANRGFTVTMIEDACAALTSEAHENWLQMHALFVGRQPAKVVLDHAQ